MMVGDGDGGGCNVITKEISRPGRGHYDVNTTISIKVKASQSGQAGGPIILPAQNGNVWIKPLPRPPDLSSLYLPSSGG